MGIFIGVSLGRKYRHNAHNSQGTDPTDNSTVICAGTAIGKSYAQDRYIKVGGTVTGLKAKLVVTFM